MNGLLNQFSTKQQLIDSVKAERENFDHLIGNINLGLMSSPILDHKWSVKDTLAHITSWEQAMIDWLQVSLQGEVPDRPAFGLSNEVINQINEQYFLENANKTLEQVLDESQTSYRMVLETLQMVTEDDLFNQNRFAWLEGNPFWPIVAANTCWHYAEHGEVLERWLSSAKS